MEKNVGNAGPESSVPRSVVIRNVQPVSGGIVAIRRAYRLAAALLFGHILFSAFWLYFFSPLFRQFVLNSIPLIGGGGSASLDSWFAGSGNLGIIIFPVIVGAISCVAVLLRGKNAGFSAGLGSLLLFIYVAAPFAGVGLYFQIVSAFPPFFLSIILGFAIILIGSAVFIRACFVIWDSFGREHRIYLKENPRRGWSVLRPVLGLLSVPSIVMQLRKRRFPILVAYFFAFLVDLFVVASAMQFLRSAGQITAVWASGGPWFAVASVIIYIIFFYFVSTRLLKFSHFLRGKGEDAILDAYKVSRLVERDAPILFLRSFRDDAVPLEHDQTGPGGEVLTRGNYKSSFDKLLVTEFGDSAGPIVALRNPREAGTPFGAVRGSARADSWKLAVSELAEKSIAIALCLDKTDGVAWELLHILEKKHLGKTVFVLTPEARSAVGDLKEMSELNSVFESLSSAGDQSEISSQLDHETLAFFQANDGKVHFISSKSATYEDYLVALRMFMQDSIKIN